MGKIHIAIGTDTNYLPHAYAMAKSLVSHVSKDVAFFILHDGVSKSDIKRFNSSLNAEMQWFDLSSHPVLNFTSLLHISRATYLRLALIEVLPKEILRIIYLDVDMIVDGDINELWDEILGSKSCGAVVDPGVSASAFAERWQLGEPGFYFNAGMLLIDVQKFREKRVMERAVRLLVADRDKCDLADQDALNVALWNDWKPLNPKWNFQRKHLYEEFKSQYNTDDAPKIIHFTESYKPWKNNEWHPWAFLYHKYSMLSPFKSNIERRLRNNFFSILFSFARWVFKRRI